MKFSSNSPIQSVRDKVFKELGLKMQEKKLKLNKLLHKTKKKKKGLSKNLPRKQEIVINDWAKKPSSPKDDIQWASNMTNDSTPQYNQELNGDRPGRKLTFGEVVSGIGEMGDNRIKVFSKFKLQEEIEQEAQIKEEEKSEITSRGKSNNVRQLSNRKSIDEQLKKSKWSSTEKSVSDVEFSLESS
jgi:hypothetical protein